MSAPLILGTNSIKDVGYNVDNSLRFNDGSSDYLQFTPSATSNQKTWTVSCWVKRSKLSSAQFIWGVNGDTAGHYFTELLFSGADNLEFRQGGTVGDPYQTQFVTNQVFRDVSAWYNIIVAADTTQSTESDRLKIYVNGSQITSFSTENYPSQNENFRWHFVSGSDYPHTIGRRGRSSSGYFGGYIAEWVDVDGSQLDATSFGEFDEDSGIWKPIDVSGLTFGTNGAYLDFEDSSALGNDVSGNNNDFTVNNLTSIDQTTDTCTNNFATLNPLEVTASTGRTLSEGNLKYTSDSSNASSATGTFAVNSGKWYYEVKIVSQSGSASSTGKFGTFGFHDISEVSDPQNDGLTIISDSRLRGQGSTSGSQAGSAIWGVNDILMFALDMDNQNLYVGKNGSWRASDGDFDDTTPTTAIFSSIDTTKFWTPYGQKNVSADNTLSYSMNFGNPPFSISSGNSDGNGYGNFEYSVPSGYYALNTKNLAEYG